MALVMAPGIALLLGAGLALSSTAIVSKELTSLGEIFSSHGQNAIGVLLFQDVVAVLLLTLVPVFAGSSDQAWYWALPLTWVKPWCCLLACCWPVAGCCRACSMKSPRPIRRSCSCCWRW